LEKISVKLDAHKLKKINDLMFILVEKFTVNFDKLITVYLDFYKPMLENEIALANISNEDKILHIGGGYIPATPIYIVKKTDADVTTIDKDLKSVEKAKILISKLKLLNKIHVIHANALDFPLDEFNLIILSLGIKSYDEVLTYISKNMRSDARLIVRTNSSIGGNLLEKDFFLKNIFKLERIVHQKKNGLLISVLLSKK